MTTEERVEALERALWERMALGDWGAHSDLQALLREALDAHAAEAVREERDACAAIPDRVQAQIREVWASCETDREVRIRRLLLKLVAKMGEQIRARGAAR